jgi:hypothetical protein
LASSTISMPMAELTDRRGTCAGGVANVTLPLDRDGARPRADTGCCVAVLVLGGLVVVGPVVDGGMADGGAASMGGAAFVPALPWVDSEGLAEAEPPAVG